MVLGREVGIFFNGYLAGRPRILVPGAVASPGATRLVAVKLTGFEFPVIEYRPFRAFTMDQASVLAFQVYGGFEVPGSPDVIAPAGAPVPSLRPIYELGIRLAFDWRRY